jgi:RNA polymerase sigma-70 factor (family 1)
VQIRKLHSGNSGLSESDEKIALERLAQGDEQAFAYIYNHYRPFIYNVANRLVRSQELSKEILQDVFMDVWRRRELLPQINNFRAYLFTMARNLIYDHLKKQVATTAIMKEFSYASTLENSTETAMLEKQYGELLQEAVGELPPQQKQVFMMARVEGLSQEAIAEKMNLSRLTVKAHMQRALHTIRIRLEPHLSPVVALCSFASLL